VSRCERGQCAYHSEVKAQFSEGHYRTLFESIDLGFCTIEVLFDGTGRAVDYRFLDVNPAFKQQTGLLDAVGRRMRELAPAHEEHWFEIYGQVALTGTPVRFEQTAAALGRWYEVYAFRVGDPECRQVAILFSDIAARKRAERALQESEEALRRSEAEQTVARRQAEQANRAKDEFIAMMGHELRNPLAPMLTALSLMKLRGNTSREQEVLERQVAHLTRLVEDLLDVSRITRGKIELHRRPVELSDVVIRSMEIAGPLLEERRITLKSRCRGKVFLSTPTLIAWPRCCRTCSPTPPSTATPVRELQ
jgi:PAS domain S-box-containing protein